jgi:hypothetical protein
MPTSEPALDDTLVAWDAVPDKLTTSGLLLGNGSSRAIWDNFNYDSLYEKAKLISVDKRLTSDDVAIFSEFNTTNFKVVLASLSTARRALKALRKPDEFIAERY